MKTLVTILILIPFVVNEAYSEEIFITLMTEFEKMTFDGKWTSKLEWKGTSETIVFDENAKLVIRTGHDYENLFVLINSVSDESLDRISDRGIVCIDSKNDGGNHPKKDDYCFIISVGSDQPITLQGGHFLAQTGFYKKISNHPDLRAVGGSSDDRDRYSKTPHTSYEFKIPLEIFGKSDIYGFYVGAFDASNGLTNGWPREAQEDNYPFIPTPDKWGKLISPDKSIPEFELPFLIFASTFMIIFIPRFFGWRYFKIKT